MACVVIVRFEKQLARFFVQCRFGIRVDEEAFDRDEDMSDAILLLPILF